MTSIDKETVNRLHNLTECCICLTTYTDPRILPCFHTACLKCFKYFQNKNKKGPGDVLPCPLCRRNFTVPLEGMESLPKNFFVKSLIEITKAAELKNKSVPCDTCTLVGESSDIREAMLRCLNCCENYCLSCSKIHKNQKVSKDHKVVDINSEFKDEETRQMFPIQTCKRHPGKSLDYYCNNCKIVVCISCFLVDHQTHTCKEVETVDGSFRQRLDESSKKLSHYTQLVLLKKNEVEREKTAFLRETLNTEAAIRNKSEQLKSLIDQHAQSVLDELSELKKSYLKDIEETTVEAERKLTILDRFVGYCTELKLRGSASEVCSCADNFITQGDELSKETESFLNESGVFLQVDFVATPEDMLLRNVKNVVGNLSEYVKEIESYVIVAGISSGISTSSNVIHLNLNKPAVSCLQHVPTKLHLASTAAVFCDSVFVSGIGNKEDEIWKFNARSSFWKKCTRLIKGRRQHSAAFVDHLMYMCGGFSSLDSCTTLVLFDDVEAYNAKNNNCVSVGKLVHGLHSSGNCVAFESSLYIFGGYDAGGKSSRNIQVYNTKFNTCSLLSEQMPRAESCLRAVLWQTKVILFGHKCCFLYDFDAKTWEVRDRFKTKINHFGLTVHGNIILVFGGGNWIYNNSGIGSWLLNNDIKYIPVMNVLNDDPIEWKHFGKLPSPSLMQAFGKVDFIAQGTTDGSRKSWTFTQKTKSKYKQ